MCIDSLDCTLTWRSMLCSDNLIVVYEAENNSFSVMITAQVINISDFLFLFPFQCTWSGYTMNHEDRHIYLTGVKVALIWCQSDSLTSLMFIMLVIRTFWYWLVWRTKTYEINSLIDRYEWKLIIFSELFTFLMSRMIPLCKQEFSWDPIDVERRSKNCKSKPQPTPCCNWSQSVVAAVVASASEMASTLTSWFVFVIFTSETTASHFRGGIITWKPDENIGNKVINVSGVEEGC